MPLCDSTGDIVEQPLACFKTRPGDMRCHDQVRNIRGQQRVAIDWTLLCEHIDAGAPDPTLAQCIGERLLIRDNDILTNLDALHGVTAVEGEFTITDNAALPTSEANALLDAIGEENVIGPVTISGNAP